MCAGLYGHPVYLKKLKPDETSLQKERKRNIFLNQIFRASAI